MIANLNAQISNCHANNNDIEKALLSINDAIKLNPEESMYHQSLGHLYMDTDQYQNANKQFKLILYKEPNNKDSLFFLGVTEGLIGNLDESINAFKKLIKIDPLDSEAYDNLGITYGKKKLFNDAIECFNKALEINPKYSECLISRGLCFLELNQKDKALLDFTKAMELENPNAQQYIKECS